MLNAFRFSSPARIEYGRGKLDLLKEEVRRFEARRPLIVCDAGIIDSGLLRQVEEQLADAFTSVDVFADIASNPTDQNVTSGVETARQKKSDLVIAVGGGSVMDAAKAISMLVVNGGAVHDYFGYEKMQKPGLPLIAIPTTAGTGSEVTIWAVITDTRSEIPIKDSIGSTLICPAVSLVDPCLTRSMPPALTAYTGLDALSHAIEGYYALTANPISDTLALTAMGMIVNHLPRAVFNGDNLDARDHMLLGSLMAGMAFSNSDTAAVHSLGEAIGGMYDLHHGLVMGVLLPYVMDFNLMACPDRFAAMARAMAAASEGMPVAAAAGKAVETVAGLLRVLQVPTLRTLKVARERFDALSDIAMHNLGTLDNPRKMTKQDFITVLENAYHERFIGPPA